MDPKSIIVEILKNRNYNIKYHYDSYRNYSEIIAESENSLLSEDIRVLFNIRKEIDLSINYKNFCQELSFFKNFTFKIKNRIISCQMFYRTKEIENIILMLNYYFYYRDVIFDSQKLLAENRQEFCTIDLSIKFSDLLKNKKFIEFPNLPMLDSKTGKYYLDKINKLTKYIPEKKEIEISLNGDNYLPIKISFSYFRDLRMYFIVFNSIFICVDKINEKKKFVSNSRLGIIFSYLNYYNLFDEFYINFEKELLNNLLSYNSADYVKKQ